MFKVEADRGRGEPIPVVKFPYYQHLVFVNQITFMWVSIGFKVELNVDSMLYMCSCNLLNKQNMIKTYTAKTIWWVFQSSESVKMQKVFSFEGVLRAQWISITSQCQTLSYDLSGKTNKNIYTSSQSPVSSPSQFVKIRFILLIHKLLGTLGIMLSSLQDIKII